MTSHAQRTRRRVRATAPGRARTGEREYGGTGPTGAGARPEERPSPEPSSEPVVGREAEAALLTRLVATDPAEGPSPGPLSEVLLVSGAPGSGKSTLLGLAERAAREAGRRVLRTVGSASERHLGFAGLHQLLRPVVSGPAVESLPPRQRSALRAALGLTPPHATMPPGDRPGNAPGDESGTAAGTPAPQDAPPPPTALVALALLDLFSELAATAPLLVVVDDAHWLDHGSLDVLAFVARRMADDPVTLLVGVREGEPLPGFDREHDRHELGPLDAESAHLLLDAQPAPPEGRTRMRILEEAAGNPLALVELTRAATMSATGRAAAGDHAPHATHAPADGPLPLTGRLERAFAGQAATLPAPTRDALLLLATADVSDPAATVSAGLPEADDPAWVPAQEAGLVRQSGRTVAFRHPLMRSAVYHAAAFADRREAHLTLAGRLREEPDRRAWHLAAATLHPDQEVSDALRRTADRAARRGGHAAAAAALERAAELSPDRETRARLLVDAAAAAVLTGQLSWVGELAARARAATEDPALATAAELATGRLLALTNRHTPAFAFLARVAREAGEDAAPLALEALATAAVVGYYSGEESQRTQVAGLLPAPALPDHPSEVLPRIWVRALTDPVGSRAELVPALPGLIDGAEGDPERLTVLAIVAWLLDETPLAVTTFEGAFDRWQTFGPVPPGLGGAAGWAYFERGRWAQALTVASDMALLAGAAGLDHALGCAAAVEATVLAVRGDAEGARARAARALAAVDPLESRSVAVTAWRALGLAAMAEGDHEAAYGCFRSAFDSAGEPVHYHASPPVLPELAATAARADRREEARAVVERMAPWLGAAPSPRASALLSRARALLADAGEAEPHFLAALADDAVEHWPFERAQARLDYAEWLRRQRRIAEARSLLASALETFRRLGAEPWAERARAELRAAGAPVSGPAADGLARLTPQQQEIVRLAARGLTNREVGEKLFLSPRTVGSHLYRAFPKLGVTARSQLRDAVGDAVR
ncbi:AAA family ATPase [Streptomyces daliensis]